jgi:hypothetical protein
VGPAGGHSLGEQFVTGLAGLALGVQIEIAEVMRLLEVLLEAGTVALIPLVALVIAADPRISAASSGREKRESRSKTLVTCVSARDRLFPSMCSPLSGASVNCCRKACPSLLFLAGREPIRLG